MIQAPHISSRAINPFRLPENHVCIEHGLSEADREVGVSWDRGCELDRAGDRIELNVQLR